MQMHSCTTGIVASNCSWKWLAARFQDALQVQSVLFVLSAEFEFEDIWSERWCYKPMWNLYESVFDTFDTRTLKVMWEFGVFGYIWYIFLQAIFIAILAAAAGDSWRCCAFLAFIALPSKSSWTALASSLTVLFNSSYSFHQPKRSVPVFQNKKTLYSIIHNLNHGDTVGFNATRFWVMGGFAKSRQDQICYAMLLCDNWGLQSTIVELLKFQSLSLVCPWRKSLITEVSPDFPAMKRHETVRLMSSSRDFVIVQQSDHP